MEALDVLIGKEIDFSNKFCDQINKSIEPLEGFALAHTMEVKIIDQDDYAKGHMIQYLTERWTGVDWISNSKHSFAYDASGHLIEDLNWIWESGTWVILSTNIHTYDANNGHLLQQLRKLWQSGTWINSCIVTYTYDDANGRMIQSLVKLWQSNTWINSCIVTYTYDDANGRMIQSLVTLWQSNTWVNSSKTTYTYGDATTGTKTIVIRSQGPVDLEVTTPSGLIISKNIENGVGILLVPVVASP